MIGASPRRKEDRRLLVGAGCFVDDVTPAKLLHLGVVRSTEAHARLVKVAVADARALPGVVAAWTADDLPEVAGGLPAGYGGGYKGRPFSPPAIAHDVVRHVGEPVAVVVADAAARLADALDALAVEYEPLPPLTGAEAALASPTRLHDGWSDNSTLPVGGAVGDSTAAIAAADVVVEARIRHPRLAGMSIETRGTLAYLDEAGSL